MNFEHLLFAKKDNVLTITINRPKILNALNKQTYKELVSALESANRDSEVKAIIITGAGRAFCSGGEVSREFMLKNYEMSTHDFIDKYIDEHGVIRLLRGGDKPVIAAINGVAIGGGCDIALACDLRLASEDAKFGWMYIDRAIAPDLGGTYFLPKLVGVGKALELTLLGDIIDAEEALRIGLVNKVVPGDELKTTAEQIANRIAKKPPLGVAYTKKAILKAVDSDFESALEHAFAIIDLLRKSEDHKEGILSYVEKREPRFTGR